MANVGFGGRIFLTDAEHETYLRRAPVRYTRKPKDHLCCVCGLPASESNPLENAHKIPFGIGVRLFKLTPDYLDSSENLVTAHRKTCNKQSELPIAEITSHVQALSEGPSQAQQP